MCALVPCPPHNNLVPRVIGALLEDAVLPIDAHVADKDENVEKNDVNNALSEKRNDDRKVDFFDMVVDETAASDINDLRARAEVLERVYVFTDWEKIPGPFIKLPTDGESTAVDDTRNRFEKHREETATCKSSTWRRMMAQRKSNIAEANAMTDILLVESQQPLSDRLQEMVSKLCTKDDLFSLINDSR